MIQLSAVQFHSRAMDYALAGKGARASERLGAPVVLTPERTRGFTSFGGVAVQVFCYKRCATRFQRLAFP